MYGNLSSITGEETHRGQPNITSTSVVTVWNLCPKTIMNQTICIYLVNCAKIVTQAG